MKRVPPLEFFKNIYVRFAESFVPTWTPVKFRLIMVA